MGGLLGGAALGAETWHGKPLPVEPLWGVISELRGGVLNHDIIFPNRQELRWPNPFAHRYERGVNLNLELVFVSPRGLAPIGSPRPALGGSVNLDGGTSNLYVEASWEHRWDLGAFVEASLGLAVHDGHLEQAPAGSIAFGSRVLFHLGLEVGYRFTEHQGLSLCWEHMSNAGWLDKRNQGVDSIGLRYGYRLGY